ncbi:sensor histidine kinase [Streptomyces acidiscabies]|uniref:histidine kinase n=1 Tax=Streptomyces acidiscabies TaxID=42234 RepID=A0AAP6BHR8_9ACTN|nr:sensor histidine kinase [Streptomyces acidiscabies]MDX2964947.1 sensor histidine kinase [Streptomyces acidiscabies]MDX3024238.1 sensor histidine kinase [Streptomyces acidiscabies]MDX3793045.1 sensor histidine kinase [Streptomyces acidiscabies]GAQ56153.1 nitrate/nitrite sensor protein NarX [Streptomyces acidiscabies]GAV44339.1 nitrate/nitrite sensor protein NarX [Streptomyces acidiscabies]
MNTPRRPHAPTADVWLMALAIASGVTGAVLSAGWRFGEGYLLPAAILATVGGVTLPWRHQRPLAVVTLTTLCAMGQGLLGMLVTPFLAAPLTVALYSVGTREDARTRRIAAQISGLGMTAAGIALTLRNHEFFLTVVNPVAWALLPVAFGSYVQVRRALAASRAEQAVRAREEEAHRRVIEERMRIARELHDVVAHHLALANAQASTAAHLKRSNPEQAFAILDQLSGTTASALRELKATVSVLRQTSDDENLAPAPGLARLPELTASCAAAGVTVSVVVDGIARDLSPAVDLTAYRIAQEALTNVTKHAAVPEAEVRLAYTDRYLTLTVRNAPGAVRPRGGHGYGLIGMRERALSVGGTFHAGRRPDGGFEAACTLPLHHRDPDEGDGP